MASQIFTNNTNWVAPFTGLVNFSLAGAGGHGANGGGGSPATGGGGGGGGAYGEGGINVLLGHTYLVQITVPYVSLSDIANGFATSYAFGGSSANAGSGGSGGTCSDGGGWLTVQRTGGTGGSCGVAAAKGSGGGGAAGSTGNGSTGGGGTVLANGTGGTGNSPGANGGDGMVAGSSPGGGGGGGDFPTGTGLVGGDGKVIFNWTYLTPNPTSCNPLIGLAAGGATVQVICGDASFSVGGTVSFGGVDATITSVSDSVIEVILPAHAPGLVDVVVTNPDSVSGTLTNGFTYYTYLFDLDSGAFSVAGQDVGFHRSYVAALGSGAFSVTGTPVTWKRTKTVGSGSFVVTGSPVTFNYTPSSGGHVGGPTVVVKLRKRRRAMGIDALKRQKSFGDRMRQFARSKSAMGEATGSGGGYTVPVEVVVAIDDRLQEIGIFHRLAMRQPMESKTLHIPAFDVSLAHAAGVTPLLGGIVMAWTQENATIAETEPQLSQVTSDAKTLAGVAYASNQLVTDGGAALGAFLENGFAQAIEWYVEYACFQGSGVGQPLGIVGAPATNVLNRAGAGHIAAADIASMVAGLFPGCFPRAVWACHPTVLKDVVALPQYYVAGGDPEMGLCGVLLGRPLFATEKLPVLGSQGDLMLFDPGLYLLGTRQLEIVSTREEPTGFFRYQTAFRFVWRGDGQPIPRGTATLADNSTTVGAFVALGG